MKITKARLKQIIIEELEAVMKEDEDEEQIDEAGFISQSAVNPPSHRDRPGYQRATLRGRGAPPEDPGTAATPTIHIIPYCGDPYSSLTPDRLSSAFNGSSG